MRPYFSVIIPTLNEEKFIGRAIKTILKQSFKNFELIVVDGGSNDKTVKIAKKYCKTIVSPVKGQANQINFGLKYAKGNYVCVLDADTMLPRNVLKSIHDHTLKNEEVVVGGCNWKFDDRNIKFKLFEFLANLAIRLLNTTAIFHFAKKSLFKKIKYNPNFIAYDIEFILRAKKLGEFKILDDIYFVTSTRRYKKEGFIKVLIKQSFIALDTLFKTKFITQNNYDFGNYKL